VDVCDAFVLTLGTIIDESGGSVLKIFAFHKKGHIAYELPICTTAITSSDTSGICWKGNIGFVGASNVICSFRADSGSILWTVSVEGDACRQVCQADDKHLYYVTQSGVIGALDVSDGSRVWQIHTKDAFIVAPPSIVGDTLVVLA